MSMCMNGPGATLQIRIIGISYHKSVVKQPIHPVLQGETCFHPLPDRRTTDGLHSQRSVYVVFVLLFVRNSKTLHSKHEDLICFDLFFLTKSINKSRGRRVVNKNMFWMVLFFCTAGLCVCVRSQTELVFPHNSHDAEGNKRREPLYAPSRCPVNHLLYPGSQESDWICDCAPGYVYYPEKDGCFATYRQGPCKVGEYLRLDLKAGEYLPRCEENPCGVDGVVQYKGICHELNKPGGPCQPKNANDTIKILYVVKSTLELRCVAGPEPLALIKVPRNPCPPGSRRSNSNDCRFGISEEDDD